MKPIVVVGSINIDFVVTAGRIPVPGETMVGSNFETHPGGKGANQAVAVARLDYPVEMIGRVGSDMFGERLREQLQDAGVESEGVGVAPGATGVASITVSSEGENSIVIVPGANALVTPEYVESHRALLARAGMVLSQLEIPMSTTAWLADFCRHQQIPFMLDPAPAQQLSPAILRGVRWFTPNETEAAFYAGSGDSDPACMARNFLRSGVGGVVLKMGSRGVFLATGTGPDQNTPAFPVHAVDTTAAGDAFNGAFAVGLLLKMEPAGAARFACAAAAASVTRRGAQPSMPNREEVEALMMSRI
jgi:ribokinase